MTQPKEHKEPVFGIDESAMTDIETMSVSMDDLSEGGLAECDVTIIGFKSTPGGEVKEVKGEPGKTFTTGDQIEIHQRIDNYEELDLEYQNTIQYLALPKLKTGPDGKPRRSKATKTSKYGLWLAAFEILGVSSDPQYAQTVRINSLADLIGLKYHRVRQEYPGFDGRSIVVEVPMSVYGYDNEVRVAAGLAAAMTVQEAAEAKTPVAGKK